MRSPAFAGAEFSCDSEDLVGRKLRARRVQNEMLLISSANPADFRAGALPSA
jgi:hypothetical protein